MHESHDRMMNMMNHNRNTALKLIRSLFWERHEGILVDSYLMADLFCKRHDKLLHNWIEASTALYVIANKSV